MRRRFAECGVVLEDEEIAWLHQAAGSRMIEAEHILQRFPEQFKICF